MAVRNKTPFMANEIYFITFTILGWKHIFISDKYCDLVYKWFDYMKERYNNKIYGYVIMPNHVHLLLYISDKSSKLPVLIFNGKKFLAFGVRDLLKNLNWKRLLNLLQAVIIFGTQEYLSGKAPLF